MSVPGSSCGPTLEAASFFRNTFANSLDIELWLDLEGLATLHVFDLLCKKQGWASWKLIEHALQEDYPAESSQFMVTKIQDNSFFNIHMGELGTVVRTSNPRTWKAEAGGLMCIWDQP